VTTVVRLALPGAVFLLCGAAVAAAQDMEPRRWTHLPVGTDVAGLSYVYLNGDIHVDPVLRIDDAQVQLHTGIASYTRYFALADTTARLDVQLPVQAGRWKGIVDGVPRTVTRDGLADPRLRLSANFLGAPALEEEEFRDYVRSRELRTLVGAALAVRLPLGEYSEDQLINLGENRFSIEPQLGVVQYWGAWSLEATGSLFLFTPNTDFFGGVTRREDPIYAIQGHLVRTFDGFWASIGVSYGIGGESRINGADRDDSRSSLLYGGSVGFTIPAGQGIRVGYFRREELRHIGVDGHNVLLSWSLRF
jgi:hypothetical protein